jgi:Sulfatase
VSESLRRIGAAALGLTTICLVWIVEPLVEFNHNAIYHWSGSSFVLFGATALDILAVWLMLALLLLSARSEGRWRVAVWAGVLLFAPLAAVKSMSIIQIVRPSHRLSFVFSSAAILVYFLAILLWRPAFAKQFDHVVGLTSTVLAFAAIGGGILICQLAWCGWQARALNDPMPLHHSATASATETRPRIIWIVLDELSYRQVYELRYPGLQLPAFDALASQATVFTHTTAAVVSTDNNVRTEKILPSLLTGKPVDGMRSSASGQLSIRNGETQSWQKFDQHDTVFQDALDAGYSTGIAGWYNPYCRIMPAVLDQCSWTYGPTIQNGMAADGTLATNVLQPAELLTETETLQRFLRALHLPPGKGLQEAKIHIADYLKLSAAADKALIDGSEGFVLIHFPLPHPEGIYNRMTGELTTDPASSYIDNLALADKYLAHVRSILAQSGQWDSSTIVIMGDHGWRTGLWRVTPGWTQEEERATGGGDFDERPAYIVKLAGQQKGAVIDTPFRAVQTRKLMDALFAQKIQSQEDLSAWVQQTH